MAAGGRAPHLCESCAFVSCWEAGSVWHLGNQLGAAAGQTVATTAVVCVRVCMRVRACVRVHRYAYAYLGVHSIPMPARVTLPEWWC